MKSEIERQRKSAFTLIELLIVIAIIVILAAILFPVFASAREKARQTTCSSNMRQIGMALVQYASDYDEFFPVGSAGNCAGTAGLTDWIDELLPYVKARNTFVCPDDPLNWPQSYPNSASDFPGVGNVLTSYKANGYYSWGGSYNIPLGIMVSLSDINGGPHKVLSLSQIGRPDQSIAVAEQEEVPMPWLSTLPNANVFPAGTCHTTQVLFDGNPGVSALPNGSTGWTSNGVYDYSGPNGGVTAVHSGMANFIFCDGHVKTMPPYRTCPLGASNTTDSNNMWNVTRQ